MYAGVDIEVIAPPPAAAPRIAATEDVGAMPLFQLYAEHVSMSPQAVTAGCEILQVHMAHSGGLIWLSVDNVITHHYRLSLPATRSCSCT